MGILKKLFNRTGSDREAIYFQDGQLYKLDPKYEDHWYDAEYIISDGTAYDLNSVESIRSIKCPSFETIASITSKYGATGSLDYVLRMKAGRLFDRGEKELCSACLWKSTELMLKNCNMLWKKDDYVRLISWHTKLEMPDDAQKAIKYLEKQGFIFTEAELKKYLSLPQKPSSPAQPAAPRQRKDSMSSIEKENLLAERVTIEDMKDVENSPFAWDGKIEKNMGGHAFAFMRMSDTNKEVLKSEISKLNAKIKQDLKKYPKVPQNVKIDYNKLVFDSKDYGFTRIICTPKTLTGKLAKYPFSVQFCTDFSKPDTVHGDLTYGLDGTIVKANIYVWKKENHTFLIYKTIENELTLYSIE